MTGFTGLVLLPGASGWWRFEAGTPVDTGDGSPERRESEVVAALYPAAETTLFMGLGGGLSRAQAVAIGQRMASESLLSPVDTLHFAAGAHLAVVDRTDFAAWLSALEEQGLAPDVVVPAQLVPPAPDSGFVSMMVGDEAVIRGTDFASIDDPAVTSVVTSGQSVAALLPEEVPILIARAIECAEVDLRQGSFALPRNWGGLRQFARLSLTLTAALLLVTVLTPLVLALRLQASASDMDRRSDELARTVVAKEELEPQAALERQMAGIRGPGAGFGASAAAVLEAIKAQKGSSLAALTFDPQGRLRATVQAASEAELSAIVGAIGAKGFIVTRGPTAVTNGVRRTELEARVK